MRLVPVYLYEELPTEEAKERARDWWADIESMDPYWAREHQESYEACLRLREKVVGGVLTLQQAKEQSFECSLTGYISDAVFYNCANDNNSLPTPRQLKEAFEHSWDLEMEDRLSREQIEDALQANEYEFLGCGTKY